MILSYFIAITAAIAAVFIPRFPHINFLGMNQKDVKNNKKIERDNYAPSED